MISGVPGGFRPSPAAATRNRSEGLDASIDRSDNGRDDPRLSGSEAGSHRCRVGSSRARVPFVAAGTNRDARRRVAARRRAASRAGGGRRDHDGAGDGKTGRARARRVGEVRVDLRILRRTCGVDVVAAGGAFGRDALLRLVSTARRRARRDAVEFSVLASFSLRGPGAHGGERLRAEARLERLGLLARHRGDLPRGGASRRALHDAPRSRLRCGADHRHAADSRRHADRERAGGTRGGGRGGRRAEEDGARVGRERPLRHSRGCRSRRGRDLLRRLAVDQRRPVVHRGEALHRGRADSRGVHRAIRRRHARKAMGESARGRRCGSRPRSHGPI